MFVNPDPLNNGLDNGDFQMIAELDAAPELSLADGKM